METTEKTLTILKIEDKNSPKSVFLKISWKFFRHIGELTIYTPACPALRKSANI